MTTPLKKVGQRKPKNPCPGCGVNLQRCFCAHIPQLNLKTRLALVIHTKELKRTTNTGQLALKALPNSEMFVRGEGVEALDLTHLLDPAYRTVMFYPSEDARALDQAFMDESPLPIQLIVPDGSWRQASKVHYRHHELAHIPRVMIKTPNTYTAHLRAETNEYGMSTLHAIAEALGVIEGPTVRQELIKVFEMKLAQTLAGRGQSALAYSAE